MVKKYCSMPIRVEKAYLADVEVIDPTTKEKQIVQRKRIAGVASDDKLDWYRERFSEEALQDMVTASKEKKPLKPTEGKVELFETHRETFGFGYIIDGSLERNLDNVSTEYHFVAELKEGYQQGVELWTDIKNNQIDKQLSVGGYIPDWENDYDFETDTFVNEDGQSIEIEVGVIKRFELEHIAVTPPDGAANPRTHFSATKGKVGYAEGAVYKSAMDDKFQKSFIKDKVVNSEETKGFFKDLKQMFKSMFTELKDDVKLEREEQMTKLEKGKKMVGDVKSFIEEHKEDFTDEVMKELGISFKVEPEGDPEPTPEYVVKDRLDEVVGDFESKLEEVKKSIPEPVTIPEIPEDQKEAVEALKELVTKLETRIKGLEDAVPEVPVEEPAADPDEEPEVNKDKNEDLDPKTAVWG